MQWRKPGADEATQARDIAACRRQAREQSYHELNRRLVSPPYLTGLDPRQTTLVPPLGAEGERSMIEQNLMQDCMRAQGYELAPRTERSSP